MVLNKSNVSVGEGCTVLGYTDRKAYTVIKISKNKHKCIIQRDLATPDRKPEFIKGGFAGVCINNNDICYSYEKNPKGESIAIYANNIGEYIYNDNPVIFGRNEYYDHNF